MAFTRRQFIQGTAAAAAAAATPLTWAAEPIRIGYVSPQTGPLSAFGEADAWVVEQMKSVFAKGVVVGGRRHAVDLLMRDSASSASRAGDVAMDLMGRERVALMLTAGTPDTANPVSQACEAQGVPCISSVAPWQAWFFGRKGNPSKGFDWTYHMFWGLEDVFSSFLFGWLAVNTNKRVGGLFPDDADGAAWSDKERGFPKPLAGVGFSLTDPGRYANGTRDFSAPIAAFKREGCEVVTGVMIPPDAKTFLTQAREQGLRPKVITLAKALLFPSSIDALGDLGEGLSTEVWWSPSHPFASSLTGQSARALADAYEAATHRQWTQPIGFTHALFEVAASALSRAKDGSPAALRDAVASTQMATIVGPVRWGGFGRSRNVSRTPLALGQWVKGTRFRHDLVVVNNVAAPQIPVGGQLRLLG